MRVRPRKRILKKAAELFYLRGFSNTHVGDIIEESQTYKKSFYQYFRDKNQLGLEYLDFQEERILKNTRRLSSKFRDLKGFIRHWMAFNRKLFQGIRFAGCPFANFAIQTMDQADLFHSRIHRFIRSWEFVLVEFLKRLQAEGSLPEGVDLSRLAKKIILIYEGSIYSYIMSRDLSYLELAEEEMLDLV